MSRPSPVFPLLGLWTPRSLPDPSGGERFLLFGDEVAFHGLSREALRRGDRVGMLLVDNAGRGWVVRQVRGLGHRTPSWLRVLMSLLNQGGDIVHQVDYDLGDQGKVDFDEIRKRLCASLDRNAWEWADDAASGEGEAPSLALEKVMDRARAAVMSAVDVRSLGENLDAAWPYDEDGRARPSRLDLS